MNYTSFLSFLSFVTLDFLEEHFVWDFWEELVFFLFIWDLDFFFFSLMGGRRESEEMIYKFFF